MRSDACDTLARYPNPARSPLAARHVQPASSRLGWESVVARLGLSRTDPRYWHQRRARYHPRHHPASTGRTHILVVTDRDL
jgi:hypothetical protein